jgi:GMP synthase (glutamine-hydrolysing)
MRDKRALYIQNGESDHPGLLAEALTRSGVALDIIHPYLGEPVPDSLEHHAGLVIGGGPQSAYEVNYHPYLTDECRLLLHAVAEGKPVLGLCLGAQLMAATFGARVQAGRQREIGYLPVTLTPEAVRDELFKGLPTTFTTTHWHGDVFELPRGATLLASSALTPHQAVRFADGLYGLQFHLELTPEIIDEMSHSFHDYLTDSGIAPPILRAAARQHLPPIRELALTVFGRWATLL